MKILRLTLRKKWFNMIRSGEKTEEYREIKPYWNNRFTGKTFDAIVFYNGYLPNSPSFKIELKVITIGLGKPCWGAPEREEVYILKLGKIL